MIDTFDWLYFSLGLSIIGMIVLGTIIFLANPKSFTNRNFLFLTIFGALWSFFNYLYNLPGLGDKALLFLRIHLFLAVWYTFATSSFLINFPKDKIKIAKKDIIIFIIIFLVSLLSLTKFTFEKIISFDNENRISEVKINWGIIVFALTVITSLAYGFYKFLKNFFQREEKSRGDFLIILGISLTFLLHIIFNLILPNVVKNPYYTQFGALYTFPFIIFIFYTISKYQLLNTKTILADIFIITLLILSAAQVLSKGNLIERIVRFLIFIGILINGLFLETTIRNYIRQKEKLEELNRIKSEFLSFTSHQIKAPMATAKGYAELIIEEIENVPEQAREYAKKIKNSIDDLLVLIEEFLDYRRIEEGKIELNFEKVDLVNFVKEITEKFNILAQKKKLSLNFETNLNAAPVKIDKIRFAQVIQNLIDNAIKYTQEGFVKVNLSQENNFIIVCVSDSGLGMSKELMGKLFGEFIRDPSIKKEIKGTGLGLYISKHIVDAHQGKIWAESEGPGKGSAFYIKLPIDSNNN